MPIPTSIVTVTSAAKPAMDAGIPAGHVAFSRSQMPQPIPGRIILLAVLVGLAGCRGSADDVQDRVSGDVDRAVAAADLERLPTGAEAFLATDRPWRAARSMRRFMEESDSVSVDQIVLAARAEAGWGAWPEVHALLDGVEALDTYADGIGLYLLGRANDVLGNPEGAVAAYRDFLALSVPSGVHDDERWAARLRLGLALLTLGEDAESQRVLAEVEEEVGGAAVWFPLLRADALAHAGDTAAVLRAVAGETSGFRGLRAWRARIAAALSAEDLAAARRLANAARAWASTDATRSEMLVRAGRIAVDMEDVAAGRQAFRSAIALGTGGIWAQAAAEELARGELSPDEHLAVARVYRAQGLHEESLDGYRAWLDAQVGSAPRESVILEYANALFYAERYAEADRALVPVSHLTTARMLQARVAAHRKQYDTAVDRYLAVAADVEGSANGALALLLAADVRHEAGQIDAATELFTRLTRRYPGTSQMGLAMMRLAGIAFVEEDYVAAARIWNEYRERYPSGTHAVQATYWSGRAREASGDSTAAAALYTSVRQRARDSYYAVLASRRLGVPFWPIPMAPAPGADPAAERRVSSWMRGIDLLRAAGFEDEASAEADRLVAGAGSDRATLYALAEALAARGYSQRAIRLGQRLQSGSAPNRRLLRILYPYPYRTLITEEARERGLDPFVTTALIRQESMFEVRITSHVGARGLMQIMPGTGRRLAEAVDIERWESEMLYHPEINVHLGTRYVAQHWERFDGSLPAVFSAYNAGAHRVEWWSEFPEFGHDELFTERIPFRETRDYVKILTRNYAIYRGLYEGDEGARMADAAP